MDEGVAAIWAAGIGVGGVVITAAMGFYQARKAAAAQVESALAGAREQIQGQHQAALWQVRRDAYAAFLGQIEAVRMGVAHMFGLCSVAIDILGGAPGQEPDLATARSELTESFKTLWMRESALRLAADAQVAEPAEHLMRLAKRAVDHVGEVAEAIWSSPACRPFFAGPGLRWAGNEVPIADAGELLRIDRLVQLDQGGRTSWWVLDYKLAWQPEKQAEHREQMLRYRRAVMALQPGEPVHCALINGLGNVIEIT